MRTTLTTVLYSLLLLSCVSGDGEKPRLEQRTRVSLKIVIRGPSSAEGHSYAFSEGTADARVVEKATVLFQSLHGVLNEVEGPGAVYCPVALETVHASAETLVAAQAEAFTETESYVEGTGDAFITANSYAVSRSRSRQFGKAIVEAAVNAKIGLERSKAEAIVHNKLTVFARAFATGSSSVTVRGTGSAGTDSSSHSEAAIEAVARIFVFLLAGIDCESAFVDSVGESIIEVPKTFSRSENLAFTVTNGAEAKGYSTGNATGRAFFKFP